MLIFENVNELSVLVTALLAAAVGSIWYSPVLFGMPWMRAAGLTIADEDVSKRQLLGSVVKGVLSQIVFFFILAQLIFMSQTATLPLSTLGIFVAILMSTQYLSPVIWEKRPLAYFLIHAGYTMLGIFGGIGVIAYWPW